MSLYKIIYIVSFCSLILTNLIAFWLDVALGIYLLIGFLIIFIIFSPLLYQYNRGYNSNIIAVKGLSDNGLMTLLL